MIKVENLSKKYGDHAALDDVSFEVEKGHIYGLLGPNGAGKSTTMNILTGYIAPTEGVVTINGYEMGANTLEAKKSIGYLPEIPPLYPDMRVFEYLFFVASLKKIPKKERNEELERVINATGLESVRQRLIKHLSKGYKQRVGIAEAILGSPEVIILDEPTVGLDPEQIIEIRTLIKSLKEKHTVILSSHILSEISAVCDDCLMINHGKVVAFDTTENLMKKSSDSRQSLDIVAKGSKDAVSEVLSKLPCVDEFTFVEEQEGKSKFIVFGVADKDIREDLSFGLSDARILVLEMNVNKSSLEDIYLNIMKDFETSYKDSFSEEDSNESEKEENVKEENTEDIIDDENEEIIEDNKDESEEVSDEDEESSKAESEDSKEDNE